MKNEELFQEKFEKSDQIDETIVSIYNKEGFTSVINYLESLGSTKLYLEDDDIKCRIWEWTANKLCEEEKETNLKKLIKYEDYVLSVDIDKNTKFNLPEAVIKTTKETIRVIKLSSLIPNIKNSFPYIEENKREGKCFDFVYDIAMHLRAPHKIVIGYVYGKCDKSESLHSWIEIKINGEEYVIDGTLNAMINKEGYYLIRHAKTITKISNQIFKNDVKTYMKKIEKITLAMYFVFRNEIIKELENNNELFIPKNVLTFNN